jgi:hypothetical protein
MTKEEILSKLDTIRKNNALPEKQKGMLLDKYEKMLVDADVSAVNTEKVVKAKPERKPRAPRAPKVTAPAKPMENEPDCDDLFEQDKIRKAKAAIAAEKRRNAPKKTEATKNKEAVEKASAKVEKSVEKRIKSGDVSVDEIKKIIAEYEDALKKLKQLLTRAESKMKYGGPVKDEDISKLADKARDISNHHCGCNDKYEGGGSMYAGGGDVDDDFYKKEVLEMVYDTLMGNRQYPQIKISNVKNENVNTTDGTIEFTYKLDEIYESNAPAKKITPKNVKIKLAMNQGETLSDNDKEVLNMVYDTLMQNVDYPRIKVSNIKNEGINRTDGEIEFTYKLGEVYGKNGIEKIKPITVHVSLKSTQNSQSGSKYAGGGGTERTSLKGFKVGDILLNEGTWAQIPQPTYEIIEIKGLSSGSSFMSRPYKILKVKNLLTGEIIETSEGRFDKYEKGGSMYAGGGDTGKKVYYEMPGIGSAKYTVNFHDGVSTHSDGSPFFDIRTFKSKAAMNNFIKQLSKEGYVSKYAGGGDTEEGNPFALYDTDPKLQQEATREIQKGIANGSITLKNLDSNPILERYAKVGADDSAVREIIYNKLKSKSGSMGWKHKSKK